MFTRITNSKKLTGALVALMAIMAVVGGAGMAAAQEDTTEVETGDVEIDVVDDTGAALEGDVTLYDSSDAEVATVTTDADGIATYEGVEYGEGYYIEASNSSDTLVTSDAFAHQNDVTSVSWDMDNSTLDVSGEDVEENADEDENIFIDNGAVDKLEDAGLGGLPAEFVGAVAFLIFGGVALIVALLILSKGAGFFLRD